MADAIAAMRTVVTALQPQELSELSRSPTVDLVHSKLFIAILVIGFPDRHVPKALNWAQFRGDLSSAHFSSRLLEAVGRDLSEGRKLSFEQHVDTLLASDFNPQVVGAQRLYSFCCHARRLFSRQRLHADASKRTEHLKQLLNQRHVKMRQNNIQLDDIQLQLLELQGCVNDVVKDSVELAGRIESETNQQVVATKLLSDLSSDFKAWQEELAHLRKYAPLLVGFSTLSALFVTFAGTLSVTLRDRFIRQLWLPAVKDCNMLIDLDNVEASDFLPFCWGNLQFDELFWRQSGIPNTRHVIEGMFIVEASCKTLILDKHMVVSKLLPAVARRNRDGVRVFDATLRPIAQLLDTCVKASVLIVLVGELDGDRVACLFESVVRAQSGQTEEKKVPFRMILVSADADLMLHPRLPSLLTIVEFGNAEDHQWIEEVLAGCITAEERLETTRCELALQKEYESRMQHYQLSQRILECVLSPTGSFDEMIITVDELSNIKKQLRTVKHGLEQASAESASIIAVREPFKKFCSLSTVIVSRILQLSAANRRCEISIVRIRTIFCKAYRKAKLDALDPSRSLLEDEIGMLAVVSGVLSHIRGHLSDYEHMALTTTVYIDITREQDGDQLLAFINEACRFVHTFSAHDNCEIPWLSMPIWRLCQQVSQISGFRTLVSDLLDSQQKWINWFISPAPEVDWIDGFAGRSLMHKLILIFIFRPDRLCQMIDILARRIGTRSGEVSLGDVLAQSSPVLVWHEALMDSIPAVLRAALWSFKKQAIRLMDLGSTEVSAETVVGSVRAMLTTRCCIIVNNTHLMPVRVFEEVIRLVTAQPMNDGFRFICCAPTSANLSRPSLAKCFSYYIRLSPNLSQSTLDCWMQLDVLSGDSDALEAQSVAVEPVTTSSVDTNREPAGLSRWPVIKLAACILHGLCALRSQYGANGWVVPYFHAARHLKGTLHVLEQMLRMSGDNAEPEILCALFSDLFLGRHSTVLWDRRVANLYLLHISHAVSSFDVPPELETTSESDHAYQDHVQTRWVSHFVPNVKDMLPHEKWRSDGDSLRNQFSSAIGEFGRDQLTLGPSNHFRARNRAHGVTQDLWGKLEEICAQLQLPSQLAAFLASARMDSSEAMSPLRCAVFHQGVQSEMLLRHVTETLNEVQKILHGSSSANQGVLSIVATISELRVPAAWIRLTYPTTRSLAAWIKHMNASSRHLQSWCSFTRPSVVWLAAFFSPESIIHCILCEIANLEKVAIDQRMSLAYVSSHADIGDVPMPQAGTWYIQGLLLLGAVWKSSSGTLCHAPVPGVLHPMPLLLVKAECFGEKSLQQDRFECPTYVSRSRQSFVFSTGLRTKDPVKGWVLKGVALFADYMRN